MAEIKITPELKAFMEKCNLNPFNPYAYAELAMRQQQQINEIAKNTLEEKVVGMTVQRTPLYDKWNNK